MKYFEILYPSKATVSAWKIINWYHDALANGEVEGDAKASAEDAALALDSAGMITLKKVVND